MNLQILRIAMLAAAVFLGGSAVPAGTAAKRFPGVEGSLYFVGGFGVNYVQRDGIALAPVRFGVGWRQGIALNYMNFSREMRYNPL